MLTRFSILRWGVRAAGEISLNIEALQVNYLKNGGTINVINAYDPESKPSHLTKQERLSCHKN
jgi:hypothetical protein